MACGRRWAKTATGMLMCLRGHGKERGQFKGALDGGNVMWVAPSVPELDSSNIWTDFKRACYLAIQNGAVEKYEHPTKRLIFKDSGGQITVRSATEGIRGAGLHGVFVDEAALMSESIWTEVIRPALSDRQGWAAFGSTPKGLNWFNELFKNAFELPGWKAWQLPTSQNPIISEDELQDALREVGPRAFAQEYEAQFLEIEGALWPADYFKDHIWADKWPDRFERTALALDPSMGQSEKGDYQSAVFGGLAGGIIYIDAFLIRRPPMELVAETDQFARLYGTHVVGVESNGFQSVLQDLFNIFAREHRLTPLPIVMITNKDKKIARVQRIDPYLHNKTVRFKKNEHTKKLVNQLIMFPVGEFDDGPDAMEMMLRLLRYGPKSRNQEIETILA